MNWEWAMRRARQLSYIFQERYQVRGYREDCGGVSVWLYGVERIRD